MPGSHTLDVSMRSTLDQVIVGLLPVAALPGERGDLYLDEEGTPVARHDGESVTPLQPVRWQSPAQVRGSAPVVVPEPGFVPGAGLPSGVTVLLPAAGTRPDDHRYTQWVAAWSAAASRVVPIPLSPADARTRAADLASAYTSGPLTAVDTVPQPAGSGVTVLFSGLSGSGKSTIARAVVEQLAATRSVTLLDGDVVRTHLSKGLGFSREDRDVNVRRIGWVAAEVTKHGGIAVCAPIAPYDETRRWVRSVVEAAGGPGSFVLVWVSTPIEVCEQRDVKGLYAKARSGELTGFTGVDDPYEEPADADLIVDTSQVGLGDAVAAVLAALPS